MPKELLSLSKLQVLKGIVTTDAKQGSFCTLTDLAGLKKLQKLSINVNNEAFLLENLSITLQNFEELLKLKVAWGRESLQAKLDKNSKEVRGEVRNKGNKGDRKRRPNKADDIENNKKPNGGLATAGIIKWSKTIIKRSTTFEQANQGFTYKLEKLDL
ncbi:hypothetical protein Ddye_025831 [Dipteronia dyeriana]|uniref:Uncharacterized protein n=1 Tax=Dipteronia dyeriana TaxID=168575 RepID=A0AAD9TL44_9ROSI|nr:hypothetical protein Ddye_025831 [Dipteronia dyeriana]